MSVQGTLKANELHVAQVTLDLTKQPVRLEVMAAMVDTDTGSTVAWIPVRGNLWSTSTQAALRTLLDLMEQDIAKSVLYGEVQSSGSTGGAMPAGIGEHLGDGSDMEPPQV